MQRTHGDIDPATCRIARIVLVGFMGAGKSTVGALLAQLLQWRFLDADAVLEASCPHSISDIFARTENLLSIT